MIIGYLLYLQVWNKIPKPWIFAIEFGMLFSLYLSYILYRQFIRPVELMSSGADALEDKDFQVKFLETGSKEMDKLIGVYNQMIDNLREERTESQEKHFFMEQVLETSISAIILLDFDDKIDYINPKVKTWFGKQEYKGKTLSEISHPLFEYLSKMPTILSQTIQPAGSSHRFRIESSEFIDQGFKRRFIVIEDISEEILKAEKRAYEKVIRMMAHEVNNSIGAINSIIQSTIDFEEEEPREFGEDIVYSLKVAKERNDNLNLFMRNFADIIRLPNPSKEYVSLREVVSKSAQLMRPDAQKQKIDINLNFAKEDLFINIDTSQFEQVLVNVIKNAKEAIGENGEIQIITSNSPKSLIIRDNGRGLSPEQAEKLFSPFYSNKPDGQGIGLTLTREILSNHGFEFSLQTNGGYTDFKIEFN
ncbi:MAG: two-component system nitrogen regulation sensor histidine kinase NtrY [Saprospiraceae bacterium]